MDNLWPDFEDMPKVSTAGIILKEQALALGKKFQNKITGDVVLQKRPDSFFLGVAPILPLLGGVF